VGVTVSGQHALPEGARRPRTLRGQQARARSTGADSHRDGAPHQPERRRCAGGLHRGHAGVRGGREAGADRGRGRGGAVALAHAYEELLVAQDHLHARPQSFARGYARHQGPHLLDADPIGIAAGNESRPLAAGLLHQLHVLQLSKNAHHLRVGRGELLRETIRRWRFLTAVESAGDLHQCAQSEARLGRERLIELTANRALTGFTAPKLLWLRENEPEVYSRMARIALPKDYVRLRLCGVHATDASDASGTLLLDVAARRWSTEMLDALELDAAILPEVLEGPQSSGETSGGVPVAAGGGDQAAGALGVGVAAPGPPSVVLGTSGVVFAALPAFAAEPEGRAHVFCHAVPGTWHAMGVMLSAAGALRWLRDAIAPGASYEQLLAEAAQWEPGAEGLTFLPYLAGERTPHADPDARGAFAGLSLRHTRGALVRAVLEGVAFGLRDCLDVITAVGVRPACARVSGGGARGRLWLQIVATVLGEELELPELGMSPDAERLFLHAIRQPFGAVIACGPTGSGKTTTLYAALNQLKTGRVNIITVEDPVEYRLAGVNQIQIHPKAGLTFASVGAGIRYAPGACRTVCANAATLVPHVNTATASEVRTVRRTSAAPGAKAMRGVIRGVPSLHE